MPAQIIDGRAVAEQIEKEAREELVAHKLNPGLATILVGDNPASQIYVGKKREACERAGIRFELLEFPASTEEKTVLDTVATLNGRDDIDAILVQLPLPGRINVDRVMRAVDPHKDADGFHPETLERMTALEECSAPAMIEGLKRLFAMTGMNPNGMHAVISCNSPAFALPLEICLKKNGMTSEFVPGDSPNLAEAFRRADLLIVALGRPRLVTGDMVKPGAVIIDVGTTRLGKKIVGDVDFESAKKVAGWITPVPGGVGPVTVAMLISSVVELAKRRRG